MPSKLYFITLILIFVLIKNSNCFDKSKFNEENNVLVIKDDNLEEAQKNIPYILFNFYAYWSTDATEMMPEFEKAAKILAENDPPIILVKSDGASSGVPAKYGIYKFPTLKLIINNKTTFEYQGDYTAEEMVPWTQRMIAEPA